MSIKRRPVLIEAFYEPNTYYQIDPDFFDIPVSSLAKGIYMVVVGMGDTFMHTFDELCSYCMETPEEVRGCLRELRQAGFLLSYIEGIDEIVAA